MIVYPAVISCSFLKPPLYNQIILVLPHFVLVLFQSTYRKTWSVMLVYATGAVAPVVGQVVQ